MAGLIKNIDCVVGARPNFMKIAPILAEMGGRSCLKARLIHTGQHFSPEMSDTFFKELELPRPDVYLGIAGGSVISQTSEMMRRLESVFSERRPDLVLVVGDVSSTLAAAIVSAQLHIPVAHVEAGLRSFDHSMPEEINRIVTDRLSTYFFTTEPSADCNLVKEGVSRSKIFSVGNVMIDTLLRFRRKSEMSSILETLGVERKSYAIATLHRPSNVDDPFHLQRLYEILAELSETMPVVFPVHPRTRARLAEMKGSSNGLICLPPLGYLDFLRLMSEAKLVLTDSGGIQEETTVLGVPCLTLRENTERPITIEIGTNRLIGADPNAILPAVRGTLQNGFREPQIPALWDGHAAQRIVDILQSELCAKD